MSQICYLVGESTLYDSTFYSNNNFKNRLIDLIGKQNFNKISNNFDKLLQFEEQIALISNKLYDNNCSNIKSKKYSNIIIKYKHKIKYTFLKTQNLLFISYFNNQFKLLNSDSDIEIFKNKLLIYKDLIGKSDDYYTFTNYTNKIIDKINNEYTSIINKSLIEQKQNRLIEFFKNIFNKN